MAGFFKCMLRANTSLCGDIEGEMTGLTSGKLMRSISVEKGKVIAWVVGMDDMELSKENVMSVDLVDANVTITNLASGGGKENKVNIYDIVMKDGKKGTLRLRTVSAVKVLALLK